MRSIVLTQLSAGIYFTGAGLNLARSLGKCIARTATCTDGIARCRAGRDLPLLLGPCHDATKVADSIGGRRPGRNRRHPCHYDCILIAHFKRIHYLLLPL